jgi:hypothetical protein
VSAASNVSSSDRDLKAEAEQYEADMAAQKAKSGTGSRSKLKVDDFAAPKPLKMKGDLGYKPLPSIGKGLGGGTPLPSINLGAEVEALEERKQKAGEAHRKNQAELERQRAEEESLRKQLHEEGAADVEARARHMKEQRARILAAKKKERNAKVAEENARKNKEEEDQLSEKVRAQAQARLDEQRRSQESKGGSGGSPELDPKVVEKRRAAMRMALARRMKMDLMESEEARLTKMQEDHFADLDRKLNAVEDNRRQAIKRDVEEREDRRRAQSQFAKNIAQSAAMMDNDF